MKTNWRKLIYKVVVLLIDYLVKVLPEIKQDLIERIEGNNREVK